MEKCISNIFYIDWNIKRCVNNFSRHDLFNKTSPGASDKAKLLKTENKLLAKSIIQITNLRYIIACTVQQFISINNHL